MNSKESILSSLNHRKPDRLPFYLAGTALTWIINTAYQNLWKPFGAQLESPVWSDVIQQIFITSRVILNNLNADVCGIFPLSSQTSANNRRFLGLHKKAIQYQKQNKIVFVKGLSHHSGRSSS